MASLPLPPNVSSRSVSTSALNFHILEAGYSPDRNRPLILLLHGFPELAFSWHLSTFSLTSLARDMVILVHALGYRSVRCVVGHDCGAVSAAMCALIRPDFFESVLLLSHPFNGTPSLPFNTANSHDHDHDHGTPGSRSGMESAASNSIHAELAHRNRKHYKWYYSTAAASNEMSLPPGRLHEFLRGYFHLKSGSCARNDPRPLKSWTADELIQLPFYYIMPLDATMPEAIALDMKNEPQNAQQLSQVWLPDSDLEVYVAEYGRTGFQGGLNWYRVRTAADGQFMQDFDTFAGKKIEVPCAFVSGKMDWGIYQEPEALEKMVNGEVCSDFRFLRLIEGVGHWAPQESPDEVANVILRLVRSLG
ncbi:alpha/beta fold hydrolase [Aspergillus novofumigatus IBT 16806]|uniref:Alpha/beta-hydrolase n=1 Tax=Aspergillus novofumigatus (strain IBT 16806) TaxID=1392255 RepID=A0A2I1CHM9_ASPN1|nr:alpha/beta-hydrolase [Aspergillus novofumigatus IBT 16806]PKX97142.1 alpha/beta-hydrolase [Aspergillus novofumigatus IBT 16806]